MPKSKYNGPPLRPIVRNKKQRGKICSLVRKTANTQRVRHPKVHAINIAKLPKKTLVGIALSIHQWESKQSWYDTGSLHPFMDNPLSNPANYITIAAQRAQMHGNTLIPVIAQPAPTKDSEFFEFIMGLLKVKTQVVSV